MRAMSLAADDGEGEQNEFRTLQSQLDSTQKLIATLSQQLFELKDQVFKKNFFLLFFILLFELS
jgi:restriction endonuclease S subunit